MITDSKDRRQKRSEKEYEKSIRLAYKEIYRVLKPEKCLTVTFHNTDVKLYNLMIRAAAAAGFDLEKSVYQPPSSVSVKAQMAPYGSAIGDYYIRFRKPKSENSGGASIADAGAYENIVVDAVEKLLSERGEPTASTHILNSYSDICECVKEQGCPFALDVSISDIINRHLGDEFVLVKKDGEEMLWLNPRTHNFIDRVPLSDRVEKCIINELNRHEEVAYDDLLRAVYLTFPNALTPTAYSIKDVLRNYGEKTRGKKWRLQPGVRQLGSSHDSYVRKLCELGAKYGFEAYGDVDGHRSDIRRLASEDKRLKRIREIDVIWYERNTIKYVFEVENSTGITEAIVRASNIGYRRKVKKIILVSASREELLARKTREPMLEKSLAEDPWLFVRYDAFDSFYDKERRRSKSPKDVEALHRPPGTGPEQKDMTEYTRRAGPRPPRSGRGFGPGAGPRCRGRGAVAAGRRRAPSGGPAPGSRAVRGGPRRGRGQPRAPAGFGRRGRGPAARRRRGRRRLLRDSAAGAAGRAAAGAAGARQARGRPVPPPPPRGGEGPRPRGRARGRPVPPAAAGGSPKRAAPRERLPRCPDRRSAGHTGAARAIRAQRGPYGRSAGHTGAARAGAPDVFIYIKTDPAPADGSGRRDVRMRWGTGSTASPAGGAWRTLPGGARKAWRRAYGGRPGTRGAPRGCWPTPASRPAASSWLP